MNFLIKLSILALDHILNQKFLVFTWQREYPHPRFPKLVAHTSTCKIRVLILAFICRHNCQLSAKSGFLLSEMSLLSEICRL